MNGRIEIGPDHYGHALRRVAKYNKFIMNGRIEIGPDQARGSNIAARARPPKSRTPLPTIAPALNSHQINAHRISGLRDPNQTASGSAGQPAHYMSYSASHGTELEQYRETIYRPESGDL